MKLEIYVRPFLSRIGISQFFLVCGIFGFGWLAFQEPYKKEEVRKRNAILAGSATMVVIGMATNRVVANLSGVGNEAIKIALRSWYDGRKGWLQNSLYYLGGFLSDWTMKDRTTTLEILSPKITRTLLEGCYKTATDFNYFVDCVLKTN